jgi:ketosteroid isomerase-like protein
MSQENLEAARQPIAVRARSHRRLEERFAVRFPRVLAWVARGFFRLPPHSRLRRVIVRHVVQQGLEAVNRGDYESAFLLHDPAVELNSPPAMIGLGENSVTRGREERIRFQRAWDAEWNEVRFEPAEIIDAGDCVLVVGRVKGSGLSSGAAFDSEWANLLTISAGRVIREQVFLSHGEALEAAGLSE